MSWWVYILRCADGTLYTGSTTDTDRRTAVHNSGKGAKYTRSRRPVAVVYRQLCAGHAEALQHEAAIKKLSRQEKLALIEHGPSPEIS
ncbi:MAG: GIY-YIG nuclease family protein [Intestinimonas sp.]|nr:GIY-YIG nuclease family protein [Intestinimonas sp.]